MNRKRPRIQTRGPKNGICNICGEEGPLTVDHTPPKTAIRVTDMQVRRIVEHLSVQDKQGDKLSMPQVEQGGVKYRTLCSRCNNNILGLNCDEELGKLSIGVSSHLQSGLILPWQKDLEIECSPQKIARAVLGHLKAVGINRYLMGPETECFRDYMLDLDKPIPDVIKIYYWVYPFKKNFVARDAALTDLRVGKPVNFWLMKFYPLAFLVTFNEPEGYDFGGYCFDAYRELEFNDSVLLPIPVGKSKIMHQFWPEAPDDNRFNVYGDAGYVSEMKPKK